MTHISWKEWNPGLTNDDLTLGEALDTLPGNPPDDIDPIIRLFENPKSPIAFRGAVSLERHDCIHILLGRGLLPQDEAFVIGYTMGTAPYITPLETGLFKFIAYHFYPKPYDFKKEDLKAYDLGVKAGKRNPKRALYTFPIEEHKAKTLGELRDILSINKTLLKDVYSVERNILPDTIASKRLAL